MNTRGMWRELKGGGGAKRENLYFFAT
jgi:hypothetical protein